MSNFTTRMNLEKPLAAENWDISIINSNMDKIDANTANVTICTSTTRPGTPDAGDMIFESDSTNMLMRQGSLWVPFNGKAQLCTSATRPATGLAFGGMIIYETDTGKLFVRNAANSAWLAIVLPGTAPTKSIFTPGNNQTWTKPAGMVACIVEGVGAGAAGGGAAATGVGQISLGGGGGGGGYFRKLFLATDLGGTEDVDVGAGGAAAAIGGTGGTGGITRFADGKAYVCTGNGGVGGAGSGAGSGTGAVGGGLGGTASGGDLNIQGGSGFCALYANTTVLASAAGGSSFWATSCSAPVSSGVGNAGQAYGGGSSGAANFAGSLSGKTSSAGGDGRVVVTHFF